jgi:ribosome biogenesis protein YTM1
VKVSNLYFLVATQTDEPATSLISLTLPTSSPVPALKTHSTSPFTLAVATYSGTIQIWDIRSPKHALFSARKAPKGDGSQVRQPSERGKVFGERLLAMDWDGEVIVAGGEDGEVGVWKARGE